MHIGATNSFPALQENKMSNRQSKGAQ